jgi:XRE family transcriptional regulator, regulator of sulfur utilization
MLTTRDIKVALATVVMTLGGAAGAASLIGAQATVMGSRIFEWDALKVQKTNVGERRDVVRLPTATLDELEMHITTLNAGQTSHAPHQHPAEELIIIKEGTLESFVNGEYKRVGPGSIVFQASNQPHAIRNVGTTQATYHVVQWQSPGMLQKK